MKKLLPKIGLFLGVFLLLNVGMYFLLMLTQPKVDPLDAEMHGDSTSVEHDDSEVALDESEFDHAPDPEDEQIEDEQLDSSATIEQSESAVEHPDHGAEHLLESHVESDSAQNDPENVTALTDTPKSTAEISKLAKLLESMKPDEAAVIAERLPTETIVNLVMRMKSRSGAKMMASLPVPVAASVATRMAELSGVKSPS